MKVRQTGILLALLALPVVSQAHRLDEYLQAAILSVDRSHIEVNLRLAPGVAVALPIIAEIDRDHDGFISETEASAYVQSVLRDISLQLDGRRLSMRAVASSFSTPEELEAGLGQIHITFVADFAPAPAPGPDRILIFENRHHSAVSAYLVNVLVPADQAISIERQSRNPSQSVFELAFADSSRH
jgi:hypothetical protein